MSDYIKQNSVVNQFDNSNSWVLLSSIEKSIKEKIEKVGTPLKDWNIQIYRGILTGHNEAFIISTEKRNEILDNCKDDAEKKRTEEIIRPILRGRDIKRYSYDWAGLYIIATFPSRHYDIEQYPALKAYLLTFGKQKLAQTGEKNINGIKDNNARKRTNNKWFETQDSISYWDDFSKPKIVYPNMTKYLPFYYDVQKYLTNQKCFIITGENLTFLTAFLNSSLFKYCFRDSFPELQGGTRELSKVFFEKIPVIKVTEKTEKQFIDSIKDIQDNYSKAKAKQIDSIIFNLYNLTQEEINEIGFIEIE